AADAVAAAPADVPSPAALRAIALEAADAVGPALAAAFRTPDSVARAKTSHHDLVTEHDRRTEDALAARLQAAVPGSRVLGEETGWRGTDGVDGTADGTDGVDGTVDGMAQVDAAARVSWILDPIDGTSNFTHGFALFSVSIAAAVDGTVVAGVVHAPADGLTFSADDTGAYLRTGGRAEQPLSSLQRAAPQAEAQHNLVTSYPAGEALRHEGDAALGRFGELVTTYATVRRVVSGALELCYAAAGWADVVFGVDTHPWDVAAGHLILTAAGGRYLAFTLDGEAATVPHEARCYLGLAPGRGAPVAERVMAELLADRRAARHRQ
ncbi:MAG: inositol monophosphatase, partial [Micrococcus sp.]|nr:inositol monophosphatase [Micrococcus sp.]